MKRFAALAFSAMMIFGLTAAPAQAAVIKNYAANVSWSTSSATGVATNGAKVSIKPGYAKTGMRYVRAASGKNTSWRLAGNSTWNYLPPGSTKSAAGAIEVRIK